MFIEARRPVGGAYAVELTELTESCVLPPFKKFDMLMAGFC